MTQFSDAFRKNVTITGALSAMLFSEELSGQSELANKLQIAAALSFAKRRTSTY
jgi:hypothetical protein